MNLNSILEKKELITLREGSYNRLGSGISFKINNTLFFDVSSRAYGIQKKLLRCSVEIEEKKKSFYLSGLKPVRGESNAYYFDLNNQSLRLYINSDYIFYKLIVHPESIEIKKDE